MLEKTLPKFRGRLALRDVGATTFGGLVVKHDIDIYIDTTTGAGVWVQEYIRPQLNANEPLKRLPRVRNVFIPWANVASITLFDGAVVKGLPGPLCNLSPNGIDVVPVPQDLTPGFEFENFGVRLAFIEKKAKPEPEPKLEPVVDADPVGTIAAQLLNPNTDLADIDLPDEPEVEEAKPIRKVGGKRK